MTTISGETRHSEATDSGSYRGDISGRYIEGGLSRSLGRKGPCTRM